MNSLTLTPNRVNDSFETGSDASEQVSMRYMTPDDIRKYFKSQTERYPTGHLCVSGENRECLVLTDIDASLLSSLPKASSNLIEVITGIRQIFDKILSEVGLHTQSIQAENFKYCAYSDLNFLIITPSSPSYFCLTVGKPMPRPIDLKMRFLDLPKAMRKAKTVCIDPHQKLTFEAHSSIIDTLSQKRSPEAFTTIFGMLQIEVKCWFHAPRKAKKQPQPLFIHVCTKSKTFSVRSPLGILFSLQEKQEKQKELVANTPFGLSAITEEDAEHDPES